LKRETFERDGEPRWKRLGELLDARDARVASSAEFPSLYRRVCQDLALARSRRYGADLEERLNVLALRGRNLLYARRGSPLQRVQDFVVAGFPRQVRALRGSLWTACAVFLVPFVLFLVLAWLAPSAIESVLDPDTMRSFEQMYDPEVARRHLGRDSADDFTMFGYYVFNNVGIAFRTFASGALFGLGSLFFLGFNGLYLGAVAGYLSTQQMGGTLWPFVIGHGSFELTGIVLSGQAGLHLGYALLAPGRRKRSQALREAGRASGVIVLGAGIMLVLAAVIEAFWSSSGVPVAVKFSVGGLMWAAVIGYLAFGGRVRAIRAD
jgi:uncharacterized membrane protein SpoIIM required for sporulation